MIRILRGPYPAVRARLQAQYHRDPQTLWIPEERPPGGPASGEPHLPPRSWGAARWLLGQVVAVRGEAVVNDVLERHRVVGAFLLGGLRDRLNEAERQEVEQLGAKLSSHLSHNWYLDGLIAERVAELLADLVADQGFTVVIPEIHRVDLMILPVLRRVLKHTPDSAPELVLGHDPQSRVSWRDDDDIAWGITPERGEELLQHFTGRTDASIETVDGTELGQQGNTDLPELLDQLRLHPWDDDLDGRTLAVLDSAREAGRPLTDGELADAVAALERGFQSFCRDAPLFLGRSLLASEPELDSRQTVIVHGTVALLAHNRQFSSKDGNEAFGAFLDRHYRAALEAEEEPVRQAAWLYRLGVTAGRRSKDTSEAMAIADQALNAAARPELPAADQVYQAAWAHNLKAYLYMIDGEAEAAFQAVEQSLNVMEKYLAEAVDPSRDLVYSRTVIAYNAENLARFTGDEDRLRERTEKNIALMREHPESFAGRFAGVYWIDFFRRRYRLDLALEAAEQGLADAGQDFARYVWFHRLQLGDLLYCRGDAIGALEQFEKSWQMKDDPDSLRDETAFSLALAALRADQPERAEKLLNQALGRESEFDRQDKDAAGQAEILATLAEAAARRKDETVAEERLEAAIDLAVAVGARDLLMRIARSAGRVAESLGHDEEAGEAYSRGLEVAGFPTAVADDSLPAGELINLLVGAACCNGRDARLTRHALRVMPRALVEDSEAWWSLPRFLPLLQPLLEESQDWGDEELDALRVVIAAASQRADCREDLQRLTSLLPPELHRRAVEL